MAVAQAKEKNGMMGKHPSTNSGGARKRVLLCVLLAAVAAVAVVAVLLVQQAGTPGSSSQEEAASQKATVTVNVSGEGFDPSTSTPVPLHVTGDGVSKNVYTDSSGNAEIELVPGVYVVKVAAPCYASDGSLFGSDDSVATSVTVNEGDENVSVLMTVSSLDLATVSADDMSKADFFARKAGADTTTILKYSAATNTRRHNAIDCLAIKEADERQEPESQVEDEKQRALDANPSIIHSTQDNQDSDEVTLTGTVCMETRAFPVYPDKSADVYYLELPSQVTVTGTQYGDQSNTKMIISQVDSPSSSDYAYAMCVGKTVSVKGKVSVNPTSSDPSFEISMLNFYDDARLMKVFS